MKQKTRSVRRTTTTRKKNVPHHRLDSQQLNLLTQSLKSVGIPTVIETRMSTVSGMSARLLKQGNIPSRSGFGIKL